MIYPINIEKYIDDCKTWHIESFGEEPSGRTITLLRIFAQTANEAYQQGYKDGQNDNGKNMCK